MKNNNPYLKAFILCLLSFLVDLFVFKRELIQELAFYSEFHSQLHGLLRLSVHSVISVCVATAFYGLLRNIPKIGTFIQWVTWLVINISYHLAYFALDRLPNSQDLRNLIMTPTEMSVETILSTLSFELLLKGIAPVFIILTLYLISEKFLLSLFPKIVFNSVKSLVTNVIAFFVVVLFVVNPMDFSIVILDTFNNSKNLFVAYARELRYYDIQRLSYTPPTQCNR